MKRILPLAVIALFAIASSAQFMENEVPAYHKTPPAKGEKLAPIASSAELDQMNLKYGFQRRAYEAAAKVPRVLYQLPCYCFCDRSAGHQSLHNCFEGDHGSHCSTCMQEAFYAYQMTKKGKTAKQIREGIIKGEYKSIDLNSLNGPLA
ncbi:MAG TPA: CYCXC family (seleno)protein [Terriglobales bacterium]|nr:CYCXC family (seleno)protein [Terriglobales bacterium]